MNATHLLTTALGIAALSGIVHAAETTTNLPVPTPQQLAWHEAEVGLFFHWAQNVYQGGEGDNLSTPRDMINPDRFDAAQWVQAVQPANAGYMIFVAKHIGGYCAWQTKTKDSCRNAQPKESGLPMNRGIIDARIIISG